MAQLGLVHCDICERCPGIDFCLDCKQLFCESCKTLHKRQRGTIDHDFQKDEHSNTEVKSKCTKHQQNFIFLCDVCNVLICKRCAVSSHKGHAVSEIDEAMSRLKEDIRISTESKLSATEGKIMQIQSAFVSFDLEIKRAIDALKNDGSKIKELVDKEINEKIKDLNKKASLAKKELKNNLLQDAYAARDKSIEIDKRQRELQAKTYDSSVLDQIKAISKDINKIKEVTIPKMPTVTYTQKTEMKYDGHDGDLLGTCNLRKREDEECLFYARKLTSQPIDDDRARQREADRKTKEIERKKEQDRRRRQAIANRIDIQTQSDLMASFEEMM